MERFEIDRFSDYLVSELSSGVRKKAALVRTFVCKPDLLLFDEALNYLDDAGKGQLLGLIKERLEHGTAVVFSTNRATELLSTSNQIVSLLKGRLMSLEKDVIPGRAVH